MKKSILLLVFLLLIPLVLNAQVRDTAKAVSGGDIVDGSVTLPKLATDSVDSTKVVNDGIGNEDLQVNSVTTTEVRDATIAFIDLNPTEQISDQESYSLAKEINDTLSDALAIYVWVTPTVTETDQSGEGHTGTYVDVDANDWLRHRSVRSLDLEDAEYITVAHHSDFNFLDAGNDADVSIGGRAEFYSDGNDKTLASKFDDTNNKIQWIVWVDTADQLIFAFYDESAGITAREGRISSIAVPMGWHDWAVTYDETSQGENVSAGMKLYIDGQVLASTTYDGAGTYVDKEDLDNVVGIVTIFEAGNPGNNWIGEMSYLWFEQSTMSASEVLALFDVTKRYTDATIAQLRVRGAVSGPDSLFVLRNSSGETVASVDSSGNAFFGGQLGVGTGNPDEMAHINYTVDTLGGLKISGSATSGFHIQNLVATPAITDARYNHFFNGSTTAYDNTNNFGLISRGFVSTSAINSYWDWHVSLAANSASFTILMKLLGDGSLSLAKQFTVGNDALNLSGAVNFVSAGNAQSSIAINDSDQEVHSDATGGYVFADGGMVFSAYSHVASSRNTTSADFYIGVSSDDGAITITLDTDNVAPGRTFHIKDEDGNAASNNITIDTEASETIDGAADYSITTNYAAITLYCDGTNWFITSVEFPSSNPDFAGIYIDSSSETTINTVNIFEQITTFDTDQPEDISDGAHGTDDITVGATGVYEVKFIADGESAASNKLFEFYVFELATTTSDVGFITNADPAVVSSVGHGFSAGNRIKIEGVGGATGVNDRIYTIPATALTDSTYQLDADNGTDVDSSGFGAWSSAGTATLATIQPAVHAERKFAVGGDAGSFSGGGFCTLTINKTLELWVKGTSDATNVTVDDCSFYMKRIQ